MKLNCATCDKEFEKPQKEYSRQIKRGRDRFFCSRTCSAVSNNKEHPRKGNVQLLNPSNRRDEFTPFRWFVLRAQYRDSDTDLDVQFLKQLWEEQKGTCPFTGWKLTLPHDADGCLEHTPSNASIDRVNNSKGYIKGNVRFIAVMANYARNSFDDQNLIDFCKAVVSNHA